MSNLEQLHAPPFPPLARDEFGSGKPKLFYWKGRVLLESWKGFAALHELWEFCEPETNAGEGEFEVSVEPTSQSAPRPSIEQCNAFQHLVDNKKSIRDAVLRGIFEVYPGWREAYCGQKVSSDGGKTYQSIKDFPDLYHPERMPEISSPDDLTRLIRPHTLHVLREPADGFVHIGFEFACKWDEEHGLGVLTHKANVVDVGDSTIALDHP